MSQDRTSILLNALGGPMQLVGVLVTIISHYVMDYIDPVDGV